MDAHTETDDALVQGWRAKSSQILLKASLREPGRNDLRHRMLQLDALPEGAERRFIPTASRLWSAAHFFVGFFVQFALLVGTFVLGIALVRPLFGEASIGRTAPLAIVLTVCVGVSLLLVFFWSRMYLLLWFKYLMWVPQEQAPNAASWLAAYTTCWQHSGDYWRRKEKFYVDRYRA